MMGRFVPNQTCCGGMTQNGGNSNRGRRNRLLPSSRSARPDQDHTTPTLQVTVRRGQLGGAGIHLDGLDVIGRLDLFEHALRLLVAARPNEYAVEIHARTAHAATGSERAARLSMYSLRMNWPRPFSYLS